MCSSPNEYPATSTNDSCAANTRRKRSPKATKGSRRDSSYFASEGYIANETPSFGVESDFLIVTCLPPSSRFIHDTDPCSFQRRAQDAGGSRGPPNGVPVGASTRSVRNRPSNPPTNPSKYGAPASSRPFSSKRS